MLTESIAFTGSIQIWQIVYKNSDNFWSNRDRAITNCCHPMLKSKVPNSQKKILKFWDSKCSFSLFDYLFTCLGLIAICCDSQKIMRITST